MARRGSAKRYAQALFEIAVQQDRLDQWVDDLGHVTGALENAELLALLEHAKIPLSRKVEAVDAVLPRVDPLVRNMLSLLVSRGLANMAPEVERGYQQLLNQLKGREEVQVTSVVPLAEGEKNRVTSFVSKLISREVLLDTQIDASLLGGLVIRVGDKLLDGSTRTRLDELGKRLQSDGAAIGV